MTISFTSIFGIVCVFATFVSAENFCGNWQSFKDEKCYKIMNEEGTVTYEEAVQLCSKNGSTLITIHSIEEQEFLEKYLFETLDLADNIWLGLKNNSNKFEWIDKTSIEFTNWANGSPSNKSDHKCVEMVSENSPIGKWFDIQCVKKNIAVCEKTPELTFNYLKKRLSVTENELKDLKKQYKETLSICKNCIFSKSDPFIDSDENHRVFIFPLIENKNVDFDEAYNTCIKYNTTLVEINSQQKQNILESFFKKLDSNKFKDFWLNARRDSTGKWKWLRSGNDIKFTNWGSGYPLGTSGYDFINIDLSSGKWTNFALKTDNTHMSTLCEDNYFVPFTTTMDPCII